MHPTVRPYWSPLVAGIALGLTLLLAFLLTGHGLAASGFVMRLTAWLGGEVARSATESNSYLGPVLKGDLHPLAAWITWEVVGIAIGAIVAALGSGRFHLRVDGASKLRAGNRIVLAVGGGVLTGFGARLARGCTSGLGLSGGAPLAVAAFLFLIGFFVAGVVISWMVRRVWA